METPPVTVDFVRLFAEFSCGNADAEELCQTVFAWFHLLDDVQDGEIAKWGVRNLSEVSLRAAFVFAANPFYQKFQHELWPILLNSARAYGDSESGKHDQRMNEILKTQYQEFFFHVARLAGGWEHYTRMTSLHRQAPA